VPELYRFRTERGLSRHPRVIVYSLFGRLPPAHAVLATPGLDVLVVTTPAGAAELRRRSIVARAVIVEALPDRDALRRAHERLFAEHGVRYLACEGGVTVLRALHEAGLLDEVFMTTTGATIDLGSHEGVLTMLDFEREGAALIAEGRSRADSAWLFRRWRLNSR
jgi:riboflavin biosynthesis pyrimidine reductase